LANRIIIMQYSSPLGTIIEESVWAASATTLDSSSASTFAGERAHNARRALTALDNACQ
jgi:hypothetical protein